MRTSLKEALEINKYLHKDLHEDYFFHTFYWSLGKGGIQGLHLFYDDRGRKLKCWLSNPGDKVQLFNLMYRKVK